MMCADLLRGPYRGSTRGRGFTLIELVTVIVVLGILAAVAVPKFLDYRGDAKLAAVKGSLGQMRSAIGNFRLQQIVTGVASPSYPALVELETPGVVLLDGVPPNPYSTGSDPRKVVAGVTKGVPVTAGTAGGWAYKASTGEIWADTSSGAGEEGL